MTHPIRILIADDHAIVREGLTAILSGKPDLQLVGEATDGAQAVRQARELKPDVILMDLRMPVKNGLEATREIRRADPQARILMLTSFADDEEVLAAIHAGAVGYLLKETSTPELLEAIRGVAHGETPLHPDIARKLVLGMSRPPEAEVDPLTEREIDVLKLVARGQSNQIIAEALNLSPATVHFHISNILHKLQLENRTQIALYGLRKKLVRLDE